MRLPRLNPPWNQLKPLPRLLPPLNPQPRILQKYLPHPLLHPPLLSLSQLPQLSKNQLFRSLSIHILPVFLPTNSTIFPPTPSISPAPICLRSRHYLLLSPQPTIQPLVFLILSSPTASAASLMPTLSMATTAPIIVSKSATSPVPSSLHPPSPTTIVKTTM